MIAALSSLKLVAIAAGAAVILGALGTIWWLRSTIEDLEARNAHLEALADAAFDAAEANRAAMARLREDHTRTLAAVDRANRDAALAREETMRIRAEIDHAPEEDDGPVAPVLQRALERLRDARAARGDASGGAAAGGAGEPLKLLSGAGGS